MHKMGFKRDFSRWIEVIYNEPKAFIKMNGFLSQKVCIERGIRQGCLLSCLIFIICVEYMALQLKQSERFQGFAFQSKECKNVINISQYADDTCLFLRDNKEIDHALFEIQHFSAVSGLVLNLTKTEGMYLGNELNANYNESKGIKWPTEPIRYLGIYIGRDTKECEKLNWVLKVEKMQKLLDSWRTRNLTIQGKITIIKCLALPKMIYSATNLPIPDNIIKDVNTILYKFIWGATDKIQRNIMINELNNGGLKMIDVESHMMALKASWIPRIFDSQVRLWQMLPLTYLKSVVGEFMFDMNFSTIKQMPCLKTIPLFYQEVIRGYAMAQNNVVINKNNLYNQVLWGNKSLMADGKCLYSKSFIESGYIYVHNILEMDGKVRSDIYENLKDKRRYLQTIRMIQISLKPYKQLRFSDQFVKIETKSDSSFSKNKCKTFYHEIIKNKQSKSKAFKKWNEFFNSNIQWSIVSQNKLINQFEPKLADFNFKFLNGLLPTAVNLVKWKKIDSTKCIYCKEADHNSLHMLWDCMYLHDLWKRVGFALNIPISLRTICLGDDTNSMTAKIISLVCYIIFKKYLRDKDNANKMMIAIITFVKNELKVRLELYLKISIPEEAKVKLQRIIEILDE